MVAEIVANNGAWIRAKLSDEEIEQVTAVLAKLADDRNPDERATPVGD